MSLTLLFSAIVLAGLLILAGGVILLLATEMKKVGTVLILISLVIIGCPLLVYILVLLRAQGNM